MSLVLPYTILTYIELRFLRCLNIIQVIGN